ncbi:MAG: hypothetical protein HOW73_20465 [Polyangiaceae bacterium]|nr:hypothetical protein [Polyangiaceae bacterium]
MKDDQTYANEAAFPEPTLEGIAAAAAQIRPKTFDARGVVRFGNLEIQVSKIEMTELHDEGVVWRPSFRDVPRVSTIRILHDDESHEDYLRLFAARHEAGHAVVAWACGFEITRAWAKPGEGAVDFQCRPEDRGGLLDDDLRVRIGAVAVAGAMTQAGLIRDDAATGPGDVDVLEEHCGTEALVKAARRRATSILRQYERAVWAVAKRLFEDGALGGETVVRVIEGSER